MYEAVTGKYHTHSEKIKFVIFDTSGWYDVDITGTDICGGVISLKIISTDVTSFTIQ